METVNHDTSVDVAQNTEAVEEDVYVFPTSFAQQRLWFLDQFEPNSPFYNIHSAIRFKGRFKVSTFEKCLNEMVHRHETLRTTFSCVDGQPVQTIHLFKPIDIPKIDLGKLPVKKQEKRVYQIAQKEAQKPFNLENGPLIRVSLLRLAKDEYVILITMHHIISDGWSMGVFVREIALLYDAFSHSRPSPLPKLEIQYGDFAEWQQEYIKGDVLKKQLSYWKKHLSGRLSLLELPTDRPRPAIQTLRGANESILIPKALSESLKSLSRKEGVTLFMTLVAAFQTLLYRYTGLEDVCIGTPIANRNRAEIEGLIGFFVNTLVLRTDLSANPSFQDLLQRVKKVTLDAYENQDLPFERLVEVLQPDRDMSHSPLFQVMLILQNAPMKVDVELSDVSISSLRVDSGTSTFDLTLMVTEQSNGFDITTEYNTDLFDAATILRFLNHFRILLNSIIKNPEQSISDLSLMAEEEKHQILYDWNETKSDYPEDQCLHQLIEIQVERSPDAIAIVQGNHKLTYKELNYRVNQLAHFLRSNGVKKGTLVGISVDRSLELLIGIQGILKSSGAYLPLDPDYPKDRLDFMIHDAKLQVCITQSKFVTKFSRHDVKLICLDRDWNEISKQNSENLNSDVTSEDLAYVIYTSGSTGKPKGVMVTHRSVVNHNTSVARIFRLQHIDRMLQFCTINFDAAVEEIFPTLQVGATLVLQDHSMLLSGSELLTLVNKHQITVLDLPTTYWHEWTTEVYDSGRKLPHCLRLVILGGDKASAEKYRLWQKVGGDSICLMNTYGPTETTVVSSFHEITKSDDGREIPIGRPISNTQLYILDAHLNPVPVGIAGELCIGGDGVTWGYLNRPELTAERFIPDPFNWKSNSRLYLTGDLVRYQQNGDIEFLGRVDHQTKIRGYRIELGEIESVLTRHPDISEVVVIAREDGTNEKRLVAYILPKNEHKPDIAKVRTFLKEQLPDYMIPSAIVIVDSFPLTPSGKVDRRGLPAPELTAYDYGDTYVPPRTHTEEVLASVWSQLLNIQKIGVLANFFELGGHSLLATQLMSRLREAFHIDLPLRSIFESPILKDLALVIDNASATEYHLEAPPVKAIARDSELPLSFAQERLWFLDQLEPNSPFYNITESFRLSGDLNTSILERSLSEIIRRHETLRTVFKTENGKPILEILPSPDLNVKYIDLRGLPESTREDEIQHLAALEAQQPFCLSEGPLFRASLLMLDTNVHVIFFTIHHIISDNWSTNVLLQEITALYDAFSNGLPSPLPELAVQYVDFAYWQRQWLQGEVFENQLNYWKKELEGSPPLLELPTDRPRPATQTFNGSYLTFELSESLSNAIQVLCTEQSTTLFMTLLAAFQTLLYRYSGQDDINLGSPIANRTRDETEGLIGFFVNTLVFRSKLDDNPSFRDLLNRTRDIALGAYAHQDLPFEKLVDALQPQRNLSHSPLFQVMFTLQNTSVGIESDAGLSVTPVEAHSGTAKFDLTLFMLERGEQLAGALEYNTDLFDHTTIARMIKHFKCLLESVVANPDQKIAKLQLLSEDERNQIVNDWNRTAKEYPNNQTVHQLFELQADRTPELIAASGKDGDLTYKELNQCANQLANYLCKLGVGPDVLVGICVEPSLEMIIDLLAILKAGGAYVPLDPAYPKERLAYMMSDSQVKVLLTQQQFLNILPEHNAQVVCPNVDWDLIAQEDIRNLAHVTSAQNLAYVIYTSGSTGKPKGTLITHGGLTNYLNWCLESYPITKGVGSLVHSTIAFDATVTGLFSPLLAGKTVRLIEDTTDVELLSEYLDDHNNFSIIKITPAHLELIGHQLLPEKAKYRTHAFIIGGENLTYNHVKFWLENAPETILINEYGPTETVVGCAVYEVPTKKEAPISIPIGRPVPETEIYILDKHLQPVPFEVSGEMYIGGPGITQSQFYLPEETADKFVPNPYATKPGERLYRTGIRAKYQKDGGLVFQGYIGKNSESETKTGSIPIGNPIANTQTYLLDREFQPVPIGITGELYIGGNGVARGYLNRPDLTAEKFVPNPFAQRQGERLYKTGDLAKYLPDGNMVFLGRTDDQVKIRGFRIELGEIESTLSQYSAIKDVVVTARSGEKADSDTSLVAYLVPKTELNFTISDVRSYLEDKIPGYMIPSAFVTLDAFPLTPNGKVDRKALPDPGHERSEMLSEYVAPRTPTEELLAGIFSQVLSVEQVGVFDNFFEIGGHSLIATQFISRLRNVFNIELPVRSLFDAPTVASLSQLVEQAKRTEEGISIPPIERVSRTEKLQLSFAQQRLWFLDQLAPEQAIYNIPSAMRLRGELNVRVLEKAINAIIERHETLRTVFDEVDGRPIQIVLSELKSSLSFIDLSGFSESEHERIILQLAREDAQQPFDLSTGSLFRTTLLQINEKDHVFLFTMHHIISDGWSINILIHEVASLYTSYINESPSPLSELPIQYADFAHWQRHWLQGEILENQIEYWRQRLTDAPPLITLPTDRSRPGIKTFNGSHITFSLSKELSKKLRILANEQEVTPFILLMAAFQILLHRYSSQDDISVGTPIANRNRFELENLIGFFVNTLVIRTDLSGDPVFKDVLNRVRETALGAYAHQDIPFEKLVEVLQPQRNLSHTPFFQVMFILQNTPTRSLELSDLLMTPLETQSNTTQFDLTLSMIDNSDQWGGTFEYNTDLFESSTIQQMIGHFQTLLESITENPEQSISQLSLLPLEERHKLLVGWNDTAEEFPHNRCIHELFEEQVERTPNAIAVDFEDQKLTYQELNARSNQLAHYLLERDVGPEGVVGLLVERSIEMVVGLLGILKAGGAYLPLDPAYPPERLSFILSDAGVSIVLTQTSLAQVLPTDVEVIDLDTEWTLISSESTLNLQCRTTALNLAYIIYTSGSTGLPKGVMLQHRGLCNLTHSQIQDFAVYPHSRVLQFASFSFDASVSEIFMTLLAGARLSLVRRERLMSIPDLMELIRLQKISVVTLPPSVLSAMPANKFLDLATIVSAGESCSKEIATSWSTGRRFVNAYGPTEATVGVSCFVADTIPSLGSSIPIGRPISNTQLYILDVNMQPVPAGVPGELYIGGSGLARGYWNGPDLTAERFIPNPFSAKSDERLYRTGDLVRFLPDGNIEFLGRIDHQVKIRGFRIELEEIEAVLGKHTKVKDVVVIVHEDEPEDKRLVAYMIPEDEQVPSVGDLRTFLSKQLPEYMIPSTFAWLDAFPLNPHGKIDRKVLSSTEVKIADSERPYIAPRDTFELKLVRIWQKVLKIDRIGIGDNFFDLGGHSLLAVQLLTQIQEKFNQEISLASFFQDPSIEHLADVLRDEKETLDWSPLFEFQKSDSKPTLYLVHPSGGSTHWYTHLAKQLGSDQSIYGIQARGLDGKLDLHTDIETMASYYIESIITHQPDGPYYLAGWSFGVIVAFEMAQQLSAMGLEIGLLAIFDQGPYFPDKVVEDEVEMMVNTFSKYFTISAEKLQSMDPDERMRFVLKKAKKAKAVPRWVRLSQFKRYLNILYVQNVAWQNYEPKTYPGNVSLFRSEDSRNGNDHGPDLGWSKLAKSGVNIYDVPGNHISMLDETHANVLADKLRFSLQND